MSASCFGWLNPCTLDLRVVMFVVPETTRSRARHTKHHGWLHTTAFQRLLSPGYERPSGVPVCRVRRSSYHFSLALASLLPPNAWTISTFRAALGGSMLTWLLCPLFPMSIYFASPWNPSITRELPTTDALATCGADALREKRIHTY